MEPLILWEFSHVPIAIKHGDVRDFASLAVKKHLMFIKPRMLIENYLLFLKYSKIKKKERHLHVIKKDLTIALYNVLC